MDQAKNPRPIAYTLRDEVQYRLDYLPLYENPDLFQYIVMYQAGDLSSRPGFHIGQHVQHYHEVCYIASGSGRFRINNITYRVQQGDLIIVRRSDIHDIVTDDRDPLRIYYFEFFFRPTVREQAPYCDILSLFETVNPCEPVRHGQEDVKPIFLGIFDELTRRRNFYGNILESYSLQLLVYVYRTFSPMTQQPEGSFAVKNDLVREVLSYLNSHFDEIDTLYDLTHVFQYSYSHLAHIFKEYAGVSLYQYYDRIRFQRAVELLRDGSNSITEIAEKLKYQSVNAFSKAFSKKFGISPSAYLTAYQSSFSRNPQYVQARRMLQKDVTGADEGTRELLLFCAGSCLSSLPEDQPPETQPPEAVSFRRIGHISEDMHDPVYD